MWMSSEDNVNYLINVMHQYFYFFLLCLASSCAKKTKSHGFEQIISDKSVSVLLTFLFTSGYVQSQSLNNLVQHHSRQERWVGSYT